MRLGAFLRTPIGALAVFFATIKCRSAAIGLRRIRPRLRRALQWPNMTTILTRERFPKEAAIPKQWGILMEFGTPPNLRGGFHQESLDRNAMDTFGIRDIMPATISRIHRLNTFRCLINGDVFTDYYRPSAHNTPGGKRWGLLRNHHMLIRTWVTFRGAGWAFHQNRPICRAICDARLFERDRAL